MENKYRFIFASLILIVLIFGISFYVNNNKQNDEYKALTPKQITALIQMKALLIYPTLPENENDVYQQIDIQTPNGKCSLYRDFLWRYYCRWN